MQLTTDGHRAYLEAAKGAFNVDVDHAQIVKLHDSAPGLAGRYSSAECTGTKKVKVEGRPDVAHVSMSYVKRQNLIIRMHTRRFTRFTTRFSEKFENHAYMITLYAVWYYFVWIHKSLRVSIAMAIGISDRLWSMEDLAGLVEAAGRKLAAKRGPNLKQAVAEAWSSLSGLRWL